MPTEQTAPWPRIERFGNIGESGLRRLRFVLDVPPPLDRKYPPTKPAAVCDDPDIASEMCRRWNGWGQQHERAATAQALCFEFIELVQQAIKRIELANKEGDPILSAWLPDATRLLEMAIKEEALA